MEAVADISNNGNAESIPDISKALEDNGMPSIPDIVKETNVVDINTETFPPDLYTDVKSVSNDDSTNNDDNNLETIDRIAAAAAEKELPDTNLNKEIANNYQTQPVQQEQLPEEPPPMEHPEDSTEESYSESLDVSMESENNSKESDDEKSTTEYIKEVDIKTIRINKGGKKIEEYELPPGESDSTVVVVTSDDTGPKEIVLRTSDGRELRDSGRVTIQQVTDESGQVYLVEAMDNVIVMEGDEVEYVEVAQQHRSPPKNIPSHVLGRNIANPSIDPFRNGKAPPKPRLGVKIPYRNLTSQIVSKQELANEILERSKRMNKDSPTGQNLFAKKLTQTLAKRLAPNSTKKTPQAEVTSALLRAQSEEKKLNNSDLIAILEGNDPESASSDKDDKVEVMTKEMEREIALKQLSELPQDEPENEAKKAAAAAAAAAAANKPPSPEKSDLKEEVMSPNNPPAAAKKNKRINKGDSNTTNSNEAEKEEDVPKRFVSSVPLKTYTRKRKPSDDFMFTEKLSPSKNDQANSGYMTKSSRIIKKKIIWDPDEASAPRKSGKTSEVPTNKLVVVRAESEKRVGKQEMKKSERADEKKPNDVKKADSPKKNEPMLRKAQTSPKQADSKKPVMKAKENSKSPSDRMAALKGKKRLSEIDKLLMDEGAVNMLYSFKNTDEDQSRKKTNKSLMSKTNELLNDLQTSSDKDSPKTLRKKESIQSITLNKSPKKLAPVQAPPTPSAISRQKSKDSNRSSIHSPPGSPTLGYSADASRIIRRHSSSSFSSMDEDDDRGKARRELRTTRRKIDSVSEPTITKKKIKKEKEDGAEEQQAIYVEQETEHDHYKTFKVKKFDQLIQILLSTNKGDKVFMNVEMMDELTLLLKELENDGGCNMVLITSTGSSFSEGINYRIVVSNKEATRKSLAKKLATSVKEFLLCLAKFPKVLVAGINGDVVGLGVTMLPLFDMIISSESATFSIPNADLGCVAEGGSLLLLPHLSQNVLVTELLYSARKLESSEALKLGLVTKVLWPGNFDNELFGNIKQMSGQSAQFMQATKKQLRQRMIPDITSSLESETDMLTQQWTSVECQKNITAKYGN